MNRRGLVEELEWVRLDFRGLVDRATVADLHKASQGTKWTNEQLLFHMLFGYLLVRHLMILVGVFARLPSGASRCFAAGLNAVTGPFHTINYVGALGGARVLRYRGMQRLMDSTTRQLESSLMRESDDSLARGMHFPVGWDPYFTDYMTVEDVYHYPTQHYNHHRRQLTLTGV